MKSKKRIILNVFTVLIICTICIIYNNIQLNKAINADKFSQYPANTYGIILMNKDGSQCDNKELKSVNDKCAYNVKFINNKDEKNDFILSVFIDFKQVSFNTTNHVSTDKYEFSLDKQQETIIPIEINTSEYNKGRHILNFIIYDNVKKIIKNSNESKYCDQIISNHDLIIDNNNDEIVKPERTFNDIIHNGNMNTFRLNIDNNSLDSNELPDESLYIKVKPDEVITLPVNIGSYTNTDEYIFFLTLDYDKVLIDNKLNYQYFTIPQGSEIRKNITFKAPKKKGNYQLTGFLVLNPWSKMDDVDKNRCFECSHRITLTVN